MANIFISETGMNGAAALHCPNADYTIELRDPNNPANPHIKTITGTTSTGIISGIRDTNNVVVDDLAFAYGQTLNIFYDDWMAGEPLAACV